MTAVGESIGPVSLRVSITDRCQLRCLYCTPPGGFRKCSHDDILRYEEIVAFVRFLQRDVGVSKVRITGGEPLARRGVVALVEMLSGLGLPDLAMSTNGQRLAEMAADLKRAGLRRVNLSLDTLMPETFRRLTGGGDLRRALAGIEAAVRHELRPTRLNAVVLRNVNCGEVADIARFGIGLGCEVRFLELMPIGSAVSRFDDWFVSSEEVRRRLEEAFELSPLPVEAGSSSRNYVARDRRGQTGIVGLISSRTNPFCPDCRRLRLTATGVLLGCLARPEGVPVRPLLRGSGPLDRAALAAAVREAMGLKRLQQHFTGQRPMACVGG